MFLNSRFYSSLFKLCTFLLLISWQNIIYGQERNLVQSMPYESQNDSLDLSNNFYDLYTYLGMNHPSEMIYSHWSTDRVKYIDASANLEFDSVYLQLADISSEKNYCHPIKSPITSRFGMRHRRFHYGIDLDLNTGDTVRCAFNGQVRVTHYDPGYGYVIVVRHDNGLETVYAHLSKFLTDTNEVVKAGDVIGLGGNTGRSRGSHLHFELRYLGVALNPETIIDFENFCLLKETIYLTEKSRKHLENIKKEQSKSSKYYTVRQGDSLGKIASKNHTTVSKLCKLNGIRESKVLRPGQKIKVQ